MSKAGWVLNHQFKTLVHLNPDMTIYLGPDVTAVFGPGEGLMLVWATGLVLPIMLADGTIPTNTITPVQ